MKETRILYFILGVLAVASIGAVGLHEDGIEFADGSFQKTAAGFTAATAVQGMVNVVVESEFSFCTAAANLYSVPAGKRLVIEWMSARTWIFGGGGLYHPADVDVTTWDGSQTVYHPLVRLENPTNVGESFFSTQRWQAPVLLYSEGNHSVTVGMCFESEPDLGSVGTVTFSGYLVDVGT